MDSNNNQWSAKMAPIIQRNSFIGGDAISPKSLKPNFGASTHSNDSKQLLLPMPSEEPPQMKELHTEIGGLKNELAALEREQLLSNERKLAENRRKLREKKKSEIARRLIEARRLQLVMEQKQSEEEEKRKNRLAFQHDMTALAEKHLTDAHDHHGRLWRVLGLRRMTPGGPGGDAASDEEVGMTSVATTSPTQRSVSPEGAHDDLFGDHDRQMSMMHQDQLVQSPGSTLMYDVSITRPSGAVPSGRGSTASGVALPGGPGGGSNNGGAAVVGQAGGVEPPVPASNPLMEAQLGWMREHVRHAAKKAKQEAGERARLEEMRLAEAEMAAEEALARADGTSGRPVIPSTLITRRTETIPELVSARAQLEALGVDPRTHRELEEQKAKEQGRLHILTQPLYIAEGGTYTTTAASSSSTSPKGRVVSQEALDEKVAARLATLVIKETQRGQEYDHRHAGERAAHGDELMVDGMVLEDTSEKNQLKRRFGTSSTTFRSPSSSYSPLLLQSTSAPDTGNALTSPVDSNVGSSLAGGQRYGGGGGGSRRHVHLIMDLGLDGEGQQQSLGNGGGLSNAGVFSPVGTRSGNHPLLITTVGASDNPVSRSGSHKGGSGNPRGSGAGWRTGLSDKDQKAQDRAALTQAQQKERFVSQLRNQKAAVSGLKEKLAQLELEAGTTITDTEVVEGHKIVSARDDRENSDTEEETASTTSTAAIAQEREVAALTIQNLYRVRSTWAALSERRLRTHETRKAEAATTIQATWRMSRCIRSVDDRKAQRRTH